MSLYVAVLWLLTAIYVGAFGFIAPISFPGGVVIEEEQSSIRQEWLDQILEKIKVSLGLNLRRDLG